MKSGARLQVQVLRRWCSSSSASVDASEQSLIAWVREQGGRVGALQVGESGHGGWGLRTTDAVRAGESLIALPPHLPLSVQTSDPVLLALFDRVPEELWTVKLGLKLLAERTRFQTSQWRPYIQNLPKRFTVPIFYSSEEIQALQYVPLMHQVQKRIRFLSEFASETMPDVIGQGPQPDHPFKRHQVLPHALAWSMAAVSSRAFHVHKSGGGSSLLPLVDMCNHSFAPTGRLVQHSSSPQSLPVLEVVAEKDLDEGEDVFLNYGSLSNDILLLDYGFVLPNNPNDRVELRYDGQLLDTACLVAKVDSLSSFKHPAQWQQELLERLQLYGPGASQSVTLGGTELVEGRLLAAVRLMHAQDSNTLIDVDLKALQIWDRTPPLGVMNERRAIRTLIGLGMLALTAFPTVIQEDESELVKGGISDNLRIATQFRILKKHLLLETIKGLKAKYPS
ncbi:hypothetical protein M758_9G162400 [Ceratodon purpureus]|nr:hypothetical protein M758_9G162400 [Ceratodon purpureus]